jgi:predicted RNase H-like nuclease
VIARHGNASVHPDDPSYSPRPSAARSIMPKITEVDACLQRDTRLRTRIHELHSELSFTRWNGGAPMQHRKASVVSRS